MQKKARLDSPCKPVREQTQTTVACSSTSNSTVRLLVGCVQVKWDTWLSGTPIDFDAVHMASAF